MIAMPGTRLSTVISKRSWIDRVARHMEEADGDTFVKHGGVAGRRARLRTQAWRGARGLLPKVLATYLPWYTPEKIAFTDEMRSYAEKFTRTAVGTSS